jgi:hypothetical protein
MYIKIIKWWLTAILVLSPFHYTIVKFIRPHNELLATSVSRLDEVSIIVCFFLAIREYYINRDFPVLLHSFWFIPVSLLCIFGFISGIVNGNSLFVTCYGTYDYVKYFAVIFIYAAFFRELGEFNKLFRVVLIATVFICAVALIEELWAVFSRYVLGSGFYDSFLYYKKAVAENRWRFGVYRTPSLIGHYNQLGLYSLLFLVVYMHITNKVSFKLFFFLFFGVFFSMSRTVYSGFMFFLGAQVFQRRKKLRIIILLVLVSIVVFSMSALPDFHVLNFISGDEEGYYTGGIPYRVYARNKAMEVWVDHPVWGTGPGMFGGGIANKYQTYINEEYNVDLKMGGLDQFWPQILAEMGIMGAVVYAGLIVSILMALFEFRRRATTGEIRNLSSGLAVYMIILFIYSLGNRLDVIDPIIFTYLALVGIGTGIAGRGNRE